MKKIGISFMIIVMLGMLGSFPCYAEDTNKNIEVELKGATNIQQTDETYTATIYLGNFKEIAENSVLGYEATLDYDETLFESVMIKGLNGWTANYSNHTKMLIGDTASAKANTEITQIIFTRKEGVKATSTEITLNNMLVTNDESDFQYDKKITITIQEDGKVEETDNTTNLHKGTEIEKNTDHSIAKKELPKAGIGIIIVLSILFFIIIILLSGKNYIVYLKDIRKQMKK